MERAAARMSSQAEMVSQNVNLEAHELFTQLRLLASLVQVGPRRGFFISIQNIVEKKTARIFRAWLAEMAQSVDETDARDSRGDPTGTNPDDDSVVWVDQNKVAGLRVRVKERKWRRDAPILFHRDEDQAVSYSLELQGASLSAIHIAKSHLIASRFQLTLHRTTHQHYASNAGCRAIAARHRHGFWQGYGFRLFCNIEYTADSR